MDQTCQDIPMRLDIKHQPLNFDIYLQQVIDIPRTSLEEAPYDFILERQALERVDQIIQSTINNETISEDDERSNQQSNLQKYMNQSPLQPTTMATQSLEPCNSHTSTHEETKTSSLVPATQTAITPSCPMEVPLTPIKCFIESTNANDSTSNSTTTTTTTTDYATSSNSNQESNSDKSKVNQINPKDFEEMHYNPFDHLELQTIDERRELDLVFQASYANQASKQL